SFRRAQGIFRRPPTARQVASPSTAWAQASWAPAFSYAFTPLLDDIAHADQPDLIRVHREFTRDLAIALRAVVAAPAEGRGAGVPQGERRGLGQHPHRVRARLPRGEARRLPLPRPAAHLRLVARHGRPQPQGGAGAPRAPHVRDDAALRAPLAGPAARGGERAAGPRRNPCAR